MQIIKALFALLLSVGIFVLVGLYSLLENLGEITSFFQRLLYEQEWVYYLFSVTLVVMMFFLLMFFLRMLFKHISKKEVYIKKEMGQIDVPLQTLESVARSSLHEIVNVEDAKVKIKLTKKLLADVEVTITEKEQYQLLTRGKEIQEQIARALPKMTGVETRNIKVNFQFKKEDPSLLSIGKKEARVV